MNNIRRSYDAEFKRNAVMLADEPGRTVSDVAESLGVRADLIYRWRRELRNQNHLAFPGKGNYPLPTSSAESKNLKKAQRY